MSHLLEKGIEVSRGTLLRAILGTLVLAQLIAIGMLCRHQVRKAQVRDLTLQVQRIAVADCLQYIPKATLNSCVARVDPAGHGGVSVMVAREPAPQQHPERYAGGSAVSVNFGYR